MGLIDSEYLSYIKNMLQPQAFLNITVNSGSSYVIPVKFDFPVDDIIFLPDGEYQDLSSIKKHIISEVDFGSLVILISINTSLSDQEEVWMQLFIIQIRSLSGFGPKLKEMYVLLI